MTTNILLENISELTGIELDTLKKIVEKNGVNFIFECPEAVNCTEKHLYKLKQLKGFISQYNEMLFLKENTTIDNYEKAGEYFINRLSLIKDKEHFEICYLNSRAEIITTETMFKGTINESTIYCRELIKGVLDHNAYSVIIAHNHPGGSLTPSSDDIKATEKIKKALETVNVKLIDHIIVAGNAYISMAAQSSKQKLGA